MGINKGMVEMKTLRIKLKQSCADLFKEIVEKIPEIKTKWVFNEELNMYSTSIRNLKIEVFETYVDLHIQEIIQEDGSVKDIQTRRFFNLGKKDKKLPMALYTTLQQRFSEFEDYRFYKKTIRELNCGIYKKRKSSEVFNEDTTSGNAK